MRKLIFILSGLLIISSIILGGCSGTVDNVDNNIPPPPSLPDDGSTTQNQAGDTAPQPPALPEE